jgi:DNA-binding NtrC family response regulator
MRKVYEQVQLLANVNAPVLVVGESGTGKEKTARVIHRFSDRRNKQFLKITCGARSPELVERELFGSDSGIVISANGDPPSAPGSLHGATIFLEDIIDLPARLQNLVLDLLETQNAHPAGNSVARTNTRIIAATAMTFDRMRATQGFSAELYFQLSTFTIKIPSLRERQEDIPFLLDHFLDHWADIYSRPKTRFAADVIDACLVYAWPGNITELENFVKRYVIMGDEAVSFCGLSHPGSDPTNRVPSLSNGSHNTQQYDLKHLLRKVKDKTEIEAITAVLGETGWNRQAAAKLLKISYRALLYKIQHYQLRPPRMSA